MAHIADALKEKGNALFKQGDFTGASEQYTLAIQRNPTNPILFTNRAFARLQLQHWDGVVADCKHSISLRSPAPNFKAWYYLAQAQLALSHPREALAAAEEAYKQVQAAATPNPSSMTAISACVIKAKRAGFLAREKERLRRQGDLQAELDELLEREAVRGLAEMDPYLRGEELRERREEIATAAETRKAELAAVFARAVPDCDSASGPGVANASATARQVPDYLVDTITFEIMHDPIMTKNGHSYERATLYEHLKRSPIDPMTREPLTIAELRPNLALRAACEEFWSGNGEWAGDW